MPATAADLADHLGISKQSCSELVQHLVTRGYLERVPDPRDGRARLLVLTDHGQACARAARSGAADTVDVWRRELTPEQFDGLQAALRAIALPGRLRPTW